MSDFESYQATQKLKELSKDPLDLSKDGVFTPKRLNKMIASNLGFKLFYGTERVDQRTMDALFQLAHEAHAIEKMEAMQKGEVINYIEGHASENRKVLHTAMRDFFDHRMESSAAKEASALAHQELEKLSGFLKEIEKQDIQHLVQIGIGGSDLGPRAIYLALKAFQKPGKSVHFVSNVDPDDALSVMKEIDLRKTLVVVVSKSGTTLETQTNEAFFRKKYLELGLSSKHHMIAVTGKGSPMDDPDQYRASFYIWDYIGGRYSATSMVGVVTLSFALGMEKVLEFLRGASAMDKVALDKNPETNLPLLSALLGIWNHNFLSYPTCAIIPYSQALSRFPAHLQQCDMESNGKRVDKKGRPVHFSTGPIIWGEPGTNGQHSFYQLIHQGTDVVPLEFIGFKNSQYQGDLDCLGTLSQEKLLSNLFAQSIGLAIGKDSENPNQQFPGNRPSRILFGKVCDAYTVGALLAYFEHKVAFQGFIWDINSFDQEGVQLGKVLSNQMIALFKNKRALKELDPKEFPLGQAYLNHLE